MNYSKVLYWLADTSIKGSILVISIILIKSLLKNRLGARGNYAIWFLLLIRVAIPFAPQSSISIFNLFNIGDYKNIITKKYIKYNPNEIISWFSGEMTEANLLHNNSNVAVEGLFTKHLSLFMESSIHFKLILLWFVVAVSLLIFTVVVNLRFGFKIRKTKTQVNDEIKEVLEECKNKMGIRNRISIVQSNVIHSPALYGIIKPTILLPKGIEKGRDKKDLQYIIFHELAHFKRKDIFVLWIITFWKIIYWFNPIIWYGFYQMHQDCEISCDALALSYIGFNDYKGYGQTIIHLLQSPMRTIKCFGVAEMLGSKSHLKRRIKMITLFKKNAYKLSIVSIAILVLMGGMFLTNAKEKNTQIDDISKENNEIQSEKNSDEINKESTKKMIWPLPGATKISSTFGIKKHPTSNKERMHTGTDIPTKKGTPIVAAKDGTVILSEVFGGYGNTIIIDHGDGLVTLYGHCSELLVEKDQKVKAGEEIAKVGKTGYATGDHLHFEIRKDDEPVDPFEGYISSEYKSK